ncbi:unnamed protein product, partial [Brassica oleracea var. botrytis]
SHAPTVSWHSSIWFLYATPKLCFGMLVLMRAVFCVNNIWNIREHLFFSCSYFQEVWSGPAQGLLPSLFSDQWQGIMAILADKNLATLKLYLIRYSFQVALHSIWREKNNRRHGFQPVLAGQLTSIIDGQIRNQCLIMDSKRIRHYEIV